ncbi:SCO6880 family protein [Subtercola frigoramans]|uniref:Type VII secretion protein EccE n=1 Tax=Subtercola frigoramans TaxID=120298 RepID=A0ABS2L238_9MICO|nr:SCO6880 family protein [Subtercola frigoramans]MBM7470551.1 hypothetical protein [Subtercola frigoramans]
MSDSSGVTRYLGGEAGHRSFFGGTRNKTRITLVGSFLLFGLVFTPVLGWPAIVIALVGVGVVFALTAQTHRGSILERRKKRARWRSRSRLGTNRFVPYDVGGWDQLHAAAVQGSKQERAAAGRQIAAMRANPDGADGMGWLQYGPNEPGIAWHHPTGEDPYFSVAFRVSGQLRGVASSGELTRAAQGWGAFLAGRAISSSRVSGVQTLTRVLPPDTARQQQWVAQALDPAATIDEQQSYRDVIFRTSEDAMVQRHYVIVSWPLNADFIDSASKYGDGRDGWRALMRAEIDSIDHGLEEAHMGAVAPLTARQTAALMLHQQNPSYPVDAVKRADPLSFGLPSHDEFSAHVVSGVDPSSGDNVEWWHRTAAIRGEALAVAARSQLWMLDLLIGRELGFVRSVSFHLNLVPAADAKAAARRDLTSDRSEAIADAARGLIEDADTRIALTAAGRRHQDLAAGSHHHGVEWIGYVTISAPTRDALAVASRQLAEVCNTGLGVDRLEWQDSYQSAASGTTWPIGRGLKTSRPTFTTRVYAGLAGRSEKEAIS